MIYVHPEDYQRFLEQVETSIPKKRYLIKLSTKMIQFYMDGIRERKDWWMICKMLQRGIGRSMNKRRQKSALLCLLH